MTTGLGFIIAEFMLIFSILCLVGVSAFADVRIKNLVPTRILVPVMVAILSYIVLGGQGGGDVFGKTLLHIDAISQYAKILVLLVVIGSLFLTSHHIQRQDFSAYEHKFDFFPVMILSTLGIFVMVSANDIMTFYMGLELQSLALYILIAFKRDNANAVEASLKYLILGALGSGLFLFGASLLYGMTGTLAYDELYQYQNFIGHNLIFNVGASLIVMALFFKLSAAPFHMWTPDVYQGAPSFVTAFVATAPKIAAVVGLLRLVQYVFFPMIEQLSGVLMLAAILSLFIGAVMAVRQTSIYRMVAYSTITHIGYILLGMAVSPDKSVNIIMGYLTVYVITSFGFFALSGQIFTQQGKNIDNIDDFAGLGTQKPYHALMMTVMMLSLAGIPPMAGFFVKFTILWHIISHTSGLASVLIPVLAVTASAISAFYYLRIIKVMYFDKPNSNFTTASGILIVPVICSVPLVLYILNPSVVQNIMDYFIRIYGFE